MKDRNRIIITLHQYAEKARRNELEELTDQKACLNSFNTAVTS